MFNLDQAVTEWRQKMAAGGIRNSAVLDELESHLREDIQWQMRVGVSPECAFELAVKKIGPASALKNEFKKSKVATGLEKLMIAAAVLFAAFGIFLGAVTIVFCYLTLAERLVAFTALGFALLAAFGWPYVIPHLPVIDQKSKRWAIEIACLLLGFGISTLFGQTIVHHFEMGLDRILPAIGFWCVFPTAVGFGFACGIEEAVKRPITKIARE